MKRALLLAIVAFIARTSDPIVLPPPQRNAQAPAWRRA